MALEDKIVKLLEELISIQKKSDKDISGVTQSNLSGKSPEEVNDVITSQLKHINDLREKEKTLQENLLKTNQSVLGVHGAIEDSKKKQQILDQEEYELLLAKIAATGKLDEEEQNDFERLEKKIKLLEKEKKAKDEIKLIGAEIFKDTEKYGLLLEQHIIDVSKLTGGYAGYFDVIRGANREIYAATTGTGIQFSEANKAFHELAKNFINLRTESQESIKDMTLVSSQLIKVGVDGNVAAKNFDVLVNAMGKTPQQAGKIQESFVQMSVKNRLSLSSVTEAFETNKNRFVGYGSEMTKVLEGLSEQALKTGIQINSLVSIAEGFDTFDDAASKVGKLNTILNGDYFNATQLLTASDEERIELLKQGVVASNVQWEGMNRFQKMAIANAAGIKDLNEAAKLFGTNLSSNNKLQADSAEVQKTLAEQSESVTLTMDKLRSSLNGLFIILDPVVSIVRTLVDGLMLLVKWGAKFGEVGSVITSVIAGLVLFSIPLLIKGFGGLGSIIGYVFSGLGKLTGGLLNFGSAAAKSDVAVTSAGGGITGFFKSLSAVSPSDILKAAAIAAIIGLTVAGIAYSLSQLKGVDWATIGMFSVAILTITGSLALLGTLISSGIGGLAILAGVAAMIGIAGAIYLISKSLSSLGEGLNRVESVSGSLGKVSLSISDFMATILSAEIEPVNQMASAVNNLADSFEKITKYTGENMTARFKSVIDTTSNTALSSYGAASNRQNTQTQQASTPQQVLIPVSVNVDGKELFKIVDARVEQVAKPGTVSLFSQLMSNSPGAKLSANLASSLMHPTGEGT